MDKKKLFIAFFAIVAIIIIALLLFRSCASGNKVVPKTSSESADSITGDETENNDKYYAAFINASVKFTCDIQNNPELATEEHANKIYGEFDLPIDDDTAMIAILKKYETNDEVLEIIREKVKKC